MKDHIISYLMPIEYHIIVTNQQDHKRIPLQYQIKIIDFLAVFDKMMQLIQILDGIHHFHSVFDELCNFVQSFPNYQCGFVMMTMIKGICEDDA